MYGTPIGAGRHGTPVGAGSGTTSPPPHRPSSCLPSCLPQFMHATMTPGNASDDSVIRPLKRASSEGGFTTTSVRVPVPMPSGNQFIAVPLSEVPVHGGKDADKQHDRKDTKLTSEQTPLGGNQNGSDGRPLSSSPSATVHSEHSLSERGGTCSTAGSPSLDSLVEDLAPQEVQLPENSSLSETGGSDEEKLAAALDCIHPIGQVRHLTGLQLQEPYYKVSLQQCKGEGPVTFVIGDRVFRIRKAPIESDMPEADPDCFLCGEIAHENVDNPYESVSGRFSPLPIPEELLDEMQARGMVPEALWEVYKDLYKKAFEQFCESFKCEISPAAVFKAVNSAYLDFVAPHLAKEAESEEAVQKLLAGREARAVATQAFWWTYQESLRLDKPIVKENFLHWFFRQTTTLQSGRTVRGITLEDAIRYIHTNGKALTFKDISFDNFAFAYVRHPADFNVIAYLHSCPDIPYYCSKERARERAFFMRYHLVGFPFSGEVDMRPYRLGEYLCPDCADTLADFSPASTICPLDDEHPYELSTDESLGLQVDMLDVHVKVIRGKPPVSLERTIFRVERDVYPIQEGETRLLTTEELRLHGFNVYSTLPSWYASSRGDLYDAGQEFLLSKTSDGHVRVTHLRVEMQPGETRLMNWGTWIYAHQARFSRITDDGRIVYVSNFEGYKGFEFYVDYINPDRCSPGPWVDPQYSGRYLKDLYDPDGEQPVPQAFTFRKLCSVQCVAKAS